MVSAVRPASAAGLLLAALLACGRPPETCAPYTPELRRFAAGAGGVRPTAGRICGGFRHALPAAGDAAAGDAATEASRAGAAPAALASEGFPAAAAPPSAAPRGLAGAALEIRRAAAGGSPDQLAAAGVVSLVAGRWREAVDLLEQAAERAPPDDARFPVDLANAYLARARAERDPLDLLLAAETAERAVELAPELPEALFTQAAALAEIGFGTEAAGAFRRFLAVESESLWAGEARRRLGHLEPPPAEDVEAVLLDAIDRGDAATLRRRVDGDRQLARELGERLLGEWAEAERRDDGSAAAPALGRARALGGALAELGGDRLVADAVAVIDHALASPLDPAPRRRLVAGHLAHAMGMEADAEYDAARAQERFADAERELAAADSPFAWRSRVYRAVQTHRQSRWDETLAAIAELVTDTDLAASYPSLVAHADWLHGLAQIVAGRPSAARDGYEAAIAGFERAGETGNATYVRGLLGEERWFIGERSAAWALWLETLRGFDGLVNPRRRHALADIMADSLAALGQPRLELRLRDRLVRLHDGDGVAVDRSHALLKRGRTLLRLGRHGKAHRDLEAAERLLPEISDDEIRELVEVDLMVSRAGLAGRASERSVADLAEAIEHYRSRGRAFPLTQLHFARARLHRRRGDLAAAEADLRAAIAALEHQRGEIRQALSRGVFLARAESIFGELISLLAEQPGRDEDALTVAEQGRSRVLLDLALRSPGAAEIADLEAVVPQPVPPLERILGALPAETEAVAYSVLEDRTIAWILRPSGVEMHRLEVSEAELSTLALELVGSAGSGASREAVAAIGERLSERIYRPLAPRLSTGGTLLLVPDGPLVGIPFAAIGGRDTGRFLIEERAVAVLPTAALLARARRRPEASRNGDRPPLVIGPGSNDPATPSLARLHGAEREAERIAELHPGAERLTGSGATEAAFVRGLAEHDLVHFAGHAVPDSRDPLRSALVLSADGADGADGDGRLEARELVLHRFDHGPTVVLAACATHDHAGRPETGITLGTALLAAGAGGVVTSLWPVEDDVTEEMMVELHHELAAGADLAEALATVQRSRIGAVESSRSRSTAWAAWVLLGE